MPNRSTADELPRDLRARSVHRLALLAGLFMAVGSFQAIATHAIKAVSVEGYPSRAEAMDGIGNLAMVLVSGLALWCFRRESISVKARSAWGLAYLLFVAQLLSLTDHADYFWKENHQLHGVPFVTILMLTLPVIVPMRPLRAFVNAMFMGATGPVALGIYATVMGYEWPSWASASSTFRLFVPVVSAALAQVVHQLGMNLKSARQLGSYTLLEELGRGGIGVVYRAQHAMLRRPTAIKMLQMSRVSDAALVRFQHEVQLTARLTHPNTVTVYDHGHATDGTFYYAMELLDGVTLDEVVQISGPLSEARVVRILKQILGSLAEAHDAHLIHRDIKPQNIMLVNRAGIFDWVKVLDFGLVRDLAHPDPGSTATDTITGTPQYLSPEAISAPETVGPAADLYAVGAVAYFLLTGQNVFCFESVVELCAAHLRVEPLPPSARLGQPLNQRLERLVLGCLRKDPAARPRSAHALLAEINQIQTDASWSDVEALAWWNLYQPSIQSRRQDRARPMSDQTLDVRTQIVGNEVRRSN